MADFTQVEMLRNKAWKLFYREKKYPLALKALTEAIGLKGKTEDYFLADEGYDKGLEDLDIAECYYFRAMIYAKKKDYDPAIADFAEAAKLRKWSRDYDGIASCYEEKGDYDSAIAYYTKGIKVGKRCCEGYESYFGRGKIYLEHKKNYDAAISDFKKSIKACGISPDSKCPGCAECHKMIDKALRAKTKEY
jgi:tetratricopeptide (TPR) repeat protein